MALTENFYFILLHIRNNLEKEKSNISIKSYTTNILKLYGKAK